MDNRYFRKYYITDEFLNLSQYNNLLRYCVSESIDFNKILNYQYMMKN